MKKHREVTTHVEEEEIGFGTFDFSRFKNAKILKRVNTDYAVAALFVLFAFILVFSVRMLPAALPLTDDWAQSTLRQNLRAQVASQVDQQFPALPAQNRESLIDRRTDEIIAGQQAEFDLVREQLSQQFKSYLRYNEDGKERTYLGDLDSYFWLRYARNIERNGMTCDAVVDGQCMDTYQNAPQGSAMPRNPSFHVFAIYGLHKFLSIFNPDQPWPASSFLLQAILGALVVIPAFFIGRKLGGNVAGLVAAVLISLHPLFLSRSLGSDNDPWIIIMSLMMFWMIIEAIETTSTTKRITFAVLAGLFTLGLAASWEGWWFVYVVILFALIGNVLFRIATESIRERNFKPWLSSKVKAAGLILIVFYVAAFILLIPTGKAAGYLQLPLLPFIAGTGLEQAVADNYWPNVLTTVAELNKASFGDAVSSMGGKLFFFIGLLGLLLMILPRDTAWNWRHYTLFGIGAFISLYLISNPGLGKFTVLTLIALPILLILVTYLFDEEHVDVAAGIIVLAWFIAATFAVYNGVRFILLLIPAFGIAFAVTCGRVYEAVSGYLNRQLTWHHFITNIIVFALIALILIQPIKAGQQTARGYIPSIDDAWWESLTKIREESAPNAIINSWWDFGHWFKYVADRRVSADGTTQHTHVPRWLGLALVTPSEQESVGVLRMLACGSDVFPYEGGKNGAYGMLLARTNDSIVAESMVRDLASRNRQDATRYLQQRGITGQELQRILNATHCDPPEDYFITSGDMVGKAGVWAHFGLWDFERAYIAQNARQMSVQEATADFTQRFNMSEEQAQALYYEALSLTTESAVNAWIAPWPGYVTQNWIGCTPTNTTLNCALGIGVSQQGNTITAIDGYVFDRSNPRNSSMVFGLYQNGQRTGGLNNGTPAVLLVADEDSIEEIAYNESQTAIGVLVDTVNNRVLVGDPLLLRSTFTHLFYLDGRYMPAFEKFDDRTGFTGTRIIVWKVNWDEEQASSAASTVRIR